MNKPFSVSQMHMKCELKVNLGNSLETAMPNWKIAHMPSLKNYMFSTSGPAKYM